MQIKRMLAVNDPVRAAEHSFAVATEAAAEI
jgi:hypothetical protein